MKSHIKIKKSQYLLLKNTPVYKKTSDDRFILYKSGKNDLENIFFSKDTHPDLYVNKNDKDKAIEEITHSLNIELYKQIKANGLSKVKTIFIQIFSEVISIPTNCSLNCLPETIELLFKGYSENTGLLIKLSEISNKGHSFFEHSINVMFFVMNYCIHCNYSESDIKRLSLGGLLHDIGKAKLPDYICSADHFLSGDEFILFKAHTTFGHDILKKNGHFDKTIAIGALEHHEKLDGSGYPRGITSISFEGQLFSIINSFEHLAYREKKYRKVKRPFEAMSIIKDETLKEGKFSKEIFKDLCISFAE